MQLQRRPIAAPACLPDKVSKSINYKKGTTQIGNLKLLNFENFISRKLWLNRNLNKISEVLESGKHR